MSRSESSRERTEYLTPFLSSKQPWSHRIGDPIDMNLPQQVSNHKVHYHRSSPRIVRHSSFAMQPSPNMGTHRAINGILMVRRRSPCATPVWWRLSTRLWKRIRDHWELKALRQSGFKGIAGQAVDSRPRKCESLLQWMKKTAVTICLYRSSVYQEEDVEATRRRVCQD